MPGNLGKTSLFYGFVGCQNDKSIEAIEIMTGLLSNMPEMSERLAYIKGAIIQQAITSGPGFRDMTPKITKWLKLGYDKDPNALFQSDYQNLTFDDIIDFYEQYIKGQPITISIVGNKKEIDFKALSKFGKIVELKTKDIMTVK